MRLVPTLLLLTGAFGWPSRAKGGVCVVPRRNHFLPRFTTKNGLIVTMLNAVHLTGRSSKNYVDFLSPHFHVNKAACFEGEHWSAAAKAQRVPVRRLDSSGELLQMSPRKRWIPLRWRRRTTRITMLALVFLGVISFPAIAAKIIHLVSGRLFFPEEKAAPKKVKIVTKPVNPKKRKSTQKPM